MKLYNWCFACGLEIPPCEHNVCLRCLHEEEARNFNHYSEEENSHEELVIVASGNELPSKPCDSNPVLHHIHNRSKENGT